MQSKASSRIKVGETCRWRHWTDPVWDAVCLYYPISFVLNDPCHQVSSPLSPTLSHLPAHMPSHPASLHPYFQPSLLGLRSMMLFLLQISVSPLNLSPNSISMELNNAFPWHCPQQTHSLCFLAVRVTAEESSFFWDRWSLFWPW